MNNSKTITNLSKVRKYSIRQICIIGILSALAAIVMLFEIPLWFAPNFYLLDFSDIIVAIGAFTLGPVSGIIIELLKNLLNLLLNGTVTGGVGEFANFVIGSSFIVPSSFIYKRMGGFKGAMIGLSAGTISLAIVGGLMNYYVLLPLFSAAFKMPIEAFVDMGTKVNSKIVDIKTLVLFATTPFNILKGIIISTITLLSFKKLSAILHK